MNDAQQIASGNHDERVRRYVEQLQRENAELRSRARRTRPLRSRTVRLERENAELREDKERLDWLEVQGEPVTYEEAPHELVWCVIGGRGQRSLRDTIDAARAKEAKP